MKKQFKEIPKVAEMIWKQLEINPTPLEDDDIKLKMICGAFYLPKIAEGRLALGEDAHFICNEENTIGVADGVGGWAKRGIDSGVFARNLMVNSLLSLRDQRLESKDVINFDVDLIRVLHEAYANTKKHDGSSTACIVTLSGQGRRTLHALNVGDSGFMVFRGNKCVYVSPIRQHHFNAPLALGRWSDGPECATEIKVQGIRHGDVIVLGTDGMLDNVTPGEIERVMEEYSGDNRVEPEQLAWIIAESLALHNSEDAIKASPFDVAAKKAGVKHKGGKKDDITVVVAQIVLALNDSSDFDHRQSVITTKCNTLP